MRIFAAILLLLPLIIVGVAVTPFHIGHGPIRTPTSIGLVNMSRKLEVLWLAVLLLLLAALALRPCLAMGCMIAGWDLLAAVGMIVLSRKSELQKSGWF